MNLAIKEGSPLLRLATIYFHLGLAEDKNIFCQIWSEIFKFLGICFKFRTIQMVETLASETFKWVSFHELSKAGQY